jgi:cyclase
MADSGTVRVTASRGVGNLSHSVAGVRDGHASALLAASVFHFGEYPVRQPKEHMAKAGLPMRLDP